MKIKATHNPGKPAVTRTETVVVTPATEGTVTLTMPIDVARFLRTAALRARYPESDSQFSMLASEIMMELRDAIRSELGDNYNLGGVMDRLKGRYNQ